MEFCRGGVEFCFTKLPKTSTAALLRKTLSANELKRSGSQKRRGFCFGKKVFYEMTVTKPPLRCAEASKDWLALRNSQSLGGRLLRKVHVLLSQTRCRRGSAKKWLVVCNDSAA